MFCWSLVIQSLSEHELVLWNYIFQIRKSDGKNQKSSSMVAPFHISQGSDQDPKHHICLSTVMCLVRGVLLITSLSKFIGTWISALKLYISN